MATTTRTSPSTTCVDRSAAPLAERSATSASRSTAGRGVRRARGIIIADTKFEFGLRRPDAHPGDEVLTPDSSRFWPADQWQPGNTAELRQATRARLSRRHRLGQAAAAARLSPRRYRRPGPATSRATNGSPGAPFADWPGARAHDTAARRLGATMAAVSFRARRGLPPSRGRRPAGLDHRALAADARIRTAPRRHASGKSIRFTVEAADDADAARRGGRGPLPALPDQPRHRGRDDHRPSTSC